MSAKHYNSLPPDYQLGKFRIESVLGEGGFGITYKAWDTVLRQTRAIKEYLPGEFAVRAEGSIVRAKSADHEENFAWGIKKFLNEAQTLARFDHPNIMRVLDLFEQNDTAYMVMVYYAGDSLQQRIRERRAARSEEEILAFVKPLLHGLAVVHAENILHLDIKPANIYIRHDTQAPVLLDFGAAKDTISQHSRSMGSIYTPGYAAIEQYHQAGKRGPWTDIYALAATLYHMVVGNPPEEAPGRVENDVVVPAAEAGRGRYTPQFLAAIDAALRVFSKDRPQSCAEWEEMLASGDRTTIAVVAQEDVAEAEASRSEVSRAAAEEGPVGDRQSGLGANQSREVPSAVSNSSASEPDTVWAPRSGKSSTPRVPDAPAADATRFRSGSLAGTSKGGGTVGEEALDELERVASPAPAQPPITGWQDREGKADEPAMDPVPPLAQVLPSEATQQQDDVYPQPSQGLPSGLGSGVGSSSLSRFPDERIAGREAEDLAVPEETSFHVADLGEGQPTDDERGVSRVRERPSDWRVPDSRLPSTRDTGGSDLLRPSGRGGSETSSRSAESDRPEPAAAVARRIEVNKREEPRPEALAITPPARLLTLAGWLLAANGLAAGVHAVHPFPQTVLGLAGAVAAEGTMAQLTVVASCLGVSTWLLFEVGALIIARPRPAQF